MRYCRFIQEGWEMGRKEKLTGGGLMRSAGGWEEVRKARNGGEFQRGDERILGSSEFVEAVLSQSRESLTPQAKYRQVGWDLDRLVQEICTRFCLNPEKIRQRGRQSALAQARSLIAYWGYQELGINGKEIAHLLGISRSGLSAAIERGKRLAAGKRLID